jgi:hypothetical protein
LSQKPFVPSGKRKFGQRRHLLPEDVGRDTRFSATQVKAARASTSCRRLERRRFGLRDQAEAAEAFERNAGRAVADRLLIVDPSAEAGDLAVAQIAIEIAVAEIG